MDYIEWSGGFESCKVTEVLDGLFAELMVDYKAVLHEKKKSIESHSQDVSARLVKNRHPGGVEEGWCATQGARRSTFWPVDVRKSC